MILTSMTLGAVAALAGGAQLVKHRKDIPHFPIVVGLGLLCALGIGVIGLIGDGLHHDIFGIVGR